METYEGVGKMEIVLNNFCRIDLYRLSTAASAGGRVLTIPFAVVLKTRLGVLLSLTNILAFHNPFQIN